MRFFSLVGLAFLGIMFCSTQKAFSDFMDACTVSPDCELRAEEAFNRALDRCDRSQQSNPNKQRDCVRVAGNAEREILKQCARKGGVCESEFLGPALYCKISDKSFPFPPAICCYRDQIVRNGICRTNLSLKKPKKPPPPPPPPSSQEACKSRGGTWTCGAAKIEALARLDNIIVSLEIESYQPACCPATSRCEPGGASPHTTPNFGCYPVGIKSLRPLISRGTR